MLILEIRDDQLVLIRDTRIFRSMDIIECKIDSWEANSIHRKVVTYIGRIVGQDTVEFGINVIKGSRIDGILGHRMYRRLWIWAEDQNFKIADSVYNKLKPIQ